VARNRKRAKERRARRPQDAPVATARAGRDEHASSPPPLEHGTPDAELAEAQLALGRPELTGEQTADEIEALTEAEEEEGEVDGYASGIPGLFPDQPHVVSAPDEEEAHGRGGRGGGRRGASRGGFDGDDDGAGGELAPAGASTPAPSTFIGSRLINFLRGSWRELQRVQWPDRRQVVQATGVVIGFVIVAGLFLGGSDWVAGKLVTFVLK
jgi:preprotein translocase subunit SecE